MFDINILKVLKKMLDIKINLLKNRLYITYSPYPESSWEKSIYAIKRAADKLSPGFSCVTRITDIRNIDDNIIRFIRQARKMLVDKGMARAVRIGEPSRRETRSANGNDPETENRYGNCKCRISTADTPEKAEIILDRWEKTREKASTQKYKSAYSISYG